MIAIFTAILVLDVVFCVFVIIWQGQRIRELEQAAEDLLDDFLKERWNNTREAREADPADWWRQ